MAHIIVNDTSPRVQYTATAAQVDFTVPFPFFTEASLLVYKTPNGQTSNDTDDLLTLNTDYTVTGEGNVAGVTLKITLTTGATAGDIITILRDEPIERTTDFQDNGDLLAETLNDEQDKEVMIMQQLEEATGRTIRAPVTDTATIGVMPSAADRAGKILEFNGSGDPVVVAPSSLISVLPSDALIYNTVASMVAASISDGATVFTRGYYSAGDGGGAVYLVKTAAAYGATPDEFGDHTLANGNVAVLQGNGEINVLQFGAESDATDQSLTYQALINSVADGTSIVIDVPFESDHLVSSPLTAGTRDVTWNLYGTVSGLSNLPGVIIRLGKKFEVIADSEPLDYSNSLADFIYQKRSVSTGIAESVSGGVLQFTNTGDGVVDGVNGTSSTINRGMQVSVSKSGDGTAHGISVIGNLRNVGSSGYNEIGMIQGSATNDPLNPSAFGNLSGLEFLCRDGTGLSSNSQLTGIDIIANGGSGYTQGDTLSVVGGTSTETATIIVDSVDGSGAVVAASIGTRGTYSVAPSDPVSVSGGAGSSATFNLTFTPKSTNCRMKAVISRISKFDDTRTHINVNYFASAEGAFAPDAVLALNHSGTSTWKVGLDLRGREQGTTTDNASFTDAAMALPNTESIAWSDSDGVLKSVFEVNNINELIVRSVKDTSTIRFLTNSGSQMFRLNASDAGTNPVNVVVSGTMKQVTQGAVDSGGTGFRVLRVAN